eukprot:tig00000912_g5448.t1
MSTTPSSDTAAEFVVVGASAIPEETPAIIEASPRIHVTPPSPAEAEHDEATAAAREAVAPTADGIGGEDEASPRARPPPRRAPILALCTQARAAVAPAVDLAAIADEADGLSHPLQRGLTPLPQGEEEAGAAVYYIGVNPGAPRPDERPERPAERAGAGDGEAELAEVDPWGAIWDYLKDNFSRAALRGHHARSSGPGPVAPAQVQARPGSPPRPASVPPPRRPGPAPQPLRVIAQADGSEASVGAGVIPHPHAARPRAGTPAGSEGGGEGEAEAEAEAGEGAEAAGEPPGEPEAAPEALEAPAARLEPAAAA